MPPRKKYQSPDAISLANRSVYNISQDMERKRKFNRHHPYDHLHPHPPHHAWERPPVSTDHDTHTHAHEEDLGPHTNQPGPIRFAKKTTQTGRKALISKEYKPVEKH